MNVADIKPLIGLGNYTVSVHLKHLKRKIDEFVAEGLELMPDFQRGRVWTTEQQIAFIEYILRGGSTAPILFNHSEWATGLDGDFVCVDGLQRLTALMLFLDDALPVFEGHRLSAIEGIERSLRAIKVQISLKSRREVLEWYLELNSGGTPHTKQELDRVRKML